MADAMMEVRFSDMRSPVDFGKLISEEAEKWAKVFKFSGAKPD